jgi:hypothetical protein
MATDAGYYRVKEGFAALNAKHARSKETIDPKFAQIVADLPGKPPGAIDQDERRSALGDGESEAAQCRIAVEIGQQVHTNDGLPVGTVTEVKGPGFRVIGRSFIGWVHYEAVRTVESFVTVLECDTAGLAGYEYDGESPGPEPASSSRGSTCSKP